MANFPELDKKPDISVIQNYNDGTLNNPMESGLEITRQRFTRIRREWQVSYRNVLQNDFDALDSFIRNTVLGMAGAFSWRNPATGENVAAVRFTQLPNMAEAGYISNGKLVAQGVDTTQAQGFSYSFNFKVREV